MSIPKIVILFPAYNVQDGDSEPHYAMLTPDRQFLAVLKEHMEATLLFLNTVPKAMTLVDDIVDFRYRRLSSDCGTAALNFISLEHNIIPAQSSSIYELLSCGTDLLHPIHSVTESLDNGNLVVLDLAEWHQRQGVHGGPLEEFWGYHDDACCPLCDEQLNIGLPIGEKYEGRALETFPYFYFTARHKHSENEADWCSIRLNVQEFIQRVGDLIMSRIE